MDGRYGGNGGDDDRARRAAGREDDLREGGERRRIELDKRPGSEPYRDAYRDDRDRQGPYRQDPYRQDPYRQDPYRDERYRDDRYRHAGNGRISRADYVPSGLSPWRDIWLHPRLVTRDFLYSSDPLRNALWLALITGVFNAMDRASSSNQGDDVSTLGLIFSILVSGLISGLLTYYVGSWLLKVVGKWVGGVGTTREMRIVSGRITGMLGIMIGLFWVPELLIAGRDAFTLATPLLDSSMTRSLLFSVLVGVESLLAIWAFVLTLHAIGEIHGFSAWKSLLVLILTGILVFLVVFLVVVIVALIFGSLFAAFGF